MSYLDRLRLDGRVAFITGGAQGIGYCCAEALAEAGAHVTIGDRDRAAIDQAIGRLEAQGHVVAGAVLDVTDSAAVTRAADDLASSAGRIDILVNNAGIARSETAAEDVADEHWLNVLDVNVNGTFWCARAFGRHMLAQGSGSIVNIGSMSGFIVNRPQNEPGFGLTRQEGPGRSLCYTVTSYAAARPEGERYE